jgi:hypothetical protein
MIVDLNGRHRRGEKAVWELKYFPIRETDCREFDILIVASRSVEGAGIRTFSMVDGTPSLWNHAGQILEKDGELVVSEANYPKHAYTPLREYFANQEKGKCRFAVLRIDPDIWGEDPFEATCIEIAAKTYCKKAHLEWFKGRRYTVGPLIPMAAFSMARNLTPFIRGRYEAIKPDDWKRIFICSVIVDNGWYAGQVLTRKDWFRSSLHPTAASPEDIWNSPYWKFIGGYAPVRIPLKPATGPHRPKRTPIPRRPEAERYWDGEKWKFRKRG